MASVLAVSRDADPYSESAMFTNGRRMSWKKFRSKWSLLGAAIVCAGMIGGFALKSGNRKSAAAASTSREAAATAPEAGGVRVEVVKPRRGGPGRTMTQLGSVFAFQTAELYSKASGFLKVQAIDIGDTVKKGQVLAEIDDPELHIEVEEAVAAVAQADAHVDQMVARVATAKANWQAAVATIAQAEAELERAKAQCSFKTKQHDRISKLFKLNSVDEKLVDEKKDEMEASCAAEHAAAAAIASAKAHVAAAAAQIEQANADVLDARSTVRVKEAMLKKAKVFAGYTMIVSPYDGVITKRHFDPGDFIRGADRGGDTPLLTVARTDLMRVVVQVPDSYVPLARPGVIAKIEITTLPGQVFEGKVSRIANAEDPQSRTMRAEIDIPNTNGKLFAGMSGDVTIKLTPAANDLAIPASCLVGAANGGKGSVYLVRDGKAKLTPVEIAADDGLDVEISRGLHAEDKVVCQYSGSIGDGVAVEITKKDPSKSQQ